MVSLGGLLQEEKNTDLYDAREDHLMASGCLQEGTEKVSAMENENMIESQTLLETAAAEAREKVKTKTREGNVDRAQWENLMDMLCYKTLALGTAAASQPLCDWKVRGKPGGLLNAQEEALLPLLRFGARGKRGPPAH